MRSEAQAAAVDFLAFLGIGIALGWLGKGDCSKRPGSRLPGRGVLFFGYPLPHTLLLSLFIATR
jgi:hypothetical protein